MPENAFAEQIVPGTYVRVLAEGLISVGGISAGNIGIVGTANPSDSEVIGVTQKLGDWESAQNVMGAYDDYAEGAGTLNLTRSLSLLFQNGARTVYAQALAAGSDQAAFTTAFNEIIKDDVNILIAPELTTDQALAVLGPLVNSSENNGKDVIAVIGSDATTSSDIADQVTANNDNGPFSQITTRRITDYAKAGIRKACNPFIGRLNNQRVRAAMQGSIDGFLTTMVQDEALTEYTLEVTATRQDEIAGRAVVNVALKPTFSIE